LNIPIANENYGFAGNENDQTLIKSGSGLVGRKSVRWVYIVIGEAVRPPDILLTGDTHIAKFSIPNSIFMSPTAHLHLLGFFHLLFCSCFIS